MASASPEPIVEGVKVRRATIADVPRIVDFNCAMAKETEGILLAVDTVHAGVLSVLEDASRGFYIVAEPVLAARPVDLIGSLFALDGTITADEAEGKSSSPPRGQNDKPVGQLLVTYEWSDWRCGDFWWIQSVYVEPAWRGRGVFRTLFEHVRTESEKRVDVAGLRLYAAAANTRAHSVYERLGMAGGRYLVFELERKAGSR